MKGWGEKMKGDNKKTKNELLEELQTLENLEKQQLLSAVQLQGKKTDVQIKLMKIFELEELYWNERSNSNWLLKGDGNTLFFHTVANGKKRKDTIFSLQQGDQVIEGDEELLKHATNFYKQLFGPAEKPSIQLDP